MDITALEHAWQEYVRRMGWTGDILAAPTVLEGSRQSWFAGYAAGSGYALSAIKRAADNTEQRLTELEKVAHPPLGQDAIYERLEALERRK